MCDLLPPLVKGGCSQHSMLTIEGTRIKKQAVFLIQVLCSFTWLVFVPVQQVLVLAHRIHLYLILHRRESGKDLFFKLILAVLDPEFVLVTSVFSTASGSLSPRVASSVTVVSRSSAVVSVTLTSVICDCSRIPFSPAGSCEMRFRGS